MTHMRNAFLLGILLVAACARLPSGEPCPKCPPEKPAPPQTAAYIEWAYEALPGWPSAGLDRSLQAFRVGCSRAKAMSKACELAAGVPADDEQAARRFFEANFAPYAIIAPDGADTGLITGYYEPIIEGSRAASEKFAYPIYGVPEDLIIVDLASIAPELRNLRLRGRLEGRRLIPYFSRSEIDAPGSSFRAPVLAWAADPVELFFLQIQGSGQVQLENGERIRVGYADQNGHPYRSLGRWLVERGELPLEEASMQGIKAWAAANPQKLRDALHANPSYVFFRELPPSDGPIGALGVPLTPEFSLAVDRRFVPLGAPVFLETTFPASPEPLARLMAAQDTGGAIRGAVRGDFYWGTGPEAGAQAGRMRQQGRMWLLWPRGEPLPSGG